MDVRIAPDGLLCTSDEAAAMLKCSRSTFNRLRQMPDFPRPFSLTDAFHAPNLWLTADLYAWAKARADAAKS